MTVRTFLGAFMQSSRQLACLGMLVTSLLVACTSSDDDDNGNGVLPGPFLDDTGLPVALAALGFTLPSPVSAEYGDTAGIDRYAAANASALLSGPVFGADSRGNDDLATPLSFRVESGGDLTLVAVWRLEGGIAAAVRNTSDRVQCGAALDGFRLLDSTGAVLPAARTPASIGGRVFISGSRGGDGDTVTETCLEADALGHLLVTVVDGAGDVFALAAESASFLLATPEASPALSPAGVIPLDYTLSATGGLTIRVVNRLAERTEVRSAFLLVLDPVGLPLMHTFIAVDDFTLAPGEEGTVSTRAPLPFSGQASTVRVFVSIRRTE